MRPSIAAQWATSEKNGYFRKLHHLPEMLNLTGFFEKNFEEAYRVSKKFQRMLIPAFEE